MSCTHRLAVPPSFSAPDLRTPPADRVCRVIVPGPAATKGSSIGLWSERDQRVVLRADAKRLPSWSRDVAWAVKAAGVRVTPSPRPVAVWAWFVFTRLKTRDLAHATMKPDVDKCLRALLDALTGVAYEDDSQVIDLYAGKRFGPTAQTVIQVWEIA